MSNFEDIKLLINAMSGTQENTLAVNRTFMKFMEDLEGGVFLSQLIFYSDKSKRKDGYFYKTYKDWYDHTFISEHKIRKLANKMKEMGFLETKLIKANASPTIHYKLDMDAFVSVFTPFLKNLRMESENIKNGILKNEESLTEITTEITNIKTLNTSSPKATKKEKYNPDSPYYQMADYMYQLIKANNPTVKQPNMQTWADEFRKMIEIDKREKEQLGDVLRFSQEDTFWQSNILSPSKLRKQYSQLYAKMTKPKQQSQQNSLFNPWEEEQYDYRTNQNIIHDHRQQLPNTPKQIGF